MIDSCRPSKLEPGFAATYSMPSVLITSTMKSEAGFSTRRDETAAGGGSVSARSCAPPGTAGAAVGEAASGGCASAAAGALRATTAAALTAAPFRNRRRPTADFEFAICAPFAAVESRGSAARFLNIADDIYVT